MRCLLLLCFIAGLVALAASPVAAGTGAADPITVAARDDGSASVSRLASANGGYGAANPASVSLAIQQQVTLTCADTSMTDVWCATLTAGVHSTFVGYNSVGDAYGTLVEPTFKFTKGGAEQTYTLKWIYFSGAGSTRFLYVAMTDASSSIYDFAGYGFFVDDLVRRIPDSGTVS